MFFSAKTLFGLDIGTSYIKAVKIRREKKAGLRLEAFDIIAIPPGVVEEGGILNREALANAIRELVKKANIKDDYVAVSISGHASVIIKMIAMPDMNEEEMAKAIKFEAEQYVPFGIEDVNLDYQVFGKRGNEGLMDVLLVAVKKDVIEDYLRVIELSDLTAVIIDLGAFALGNMYEFSYGIEEGKVVGIFDIGSGSITMTVMRGSFPAFTRQTGVGIKNIVEALEREFQIDYDSAEQIVKFGNIPPELSSDQVSEVVVNASEDLLLDIQGSLDYYMGGNADSIERILLCGGGALLGQFPETLSERVGIEVVLVNPFQSLDIPDTLDKEFIKGLAPMAAIAVGLALREIGDK